MAPKTTKSKTEVIAATNVVTLDPVEKMLLGATPDDLVALANLSIPRAERLHSVRTLLVDQPELRAQLGLEIDKAWQRAGGEREAFLKGLAERRAQILSLAEIGRSRQQVAPAVADFDREFARYLIEMEGFGAGALKS